MKNIDLSMHPLDKLFIKFPLNTYFENKKCDKGVVKKEIEENQTIVELECGI